MPLATVLIVSHKLNYCFLNKNITFGKISLVPVSWQATTDNISKNGVLIFI